MGKDVKAVKFLNHWDMFGAHYGPGVIINEPQDWMIDYATREVKSQGQQICEFTTDKAKAVKGDSGVGAIDIKSLKTKSFEEVKALATSMGIPIDPEKGSRMGLISLITKKVKGDSGAGEKTDGTPKDNEDGK